MRNAGTILKTTGIPARHSLAQSDGAESWPGDSQPSLAQPSLAQQATEGSSSCFSRCQQPRPAPALTDCQLSCPASSCLYWAAPLGAGWQATGWALDSKEQGSQRESQKLVVNVSCQQL